MIKDDFQNVRSLDPVAGQSVDGDFLGRESEFSKDLISLKLFVIMSSFCES